MSLYDRPQHYIDIFVFIIQYPELTAEEWVIVFFNLLGLIGLILIFISIIVFAVTKISDALQDCD